MLSISTQNSQKLNQIGFNPPPPSSPLTYHATLLIVQCCNLGSQKFDHCNAKANTHKIARLSLMLRQCC